MKNLICIPLLFWTIISGNVVNTDRITRIRVWSGGHSLIIFDQAGSGGEWNQLIVNNATPRQVFNIMLQNKLKE